MQPCWNFFKNLERISTLNEALRSGHHRRR